MNVEQVVSDETTQSTEFTRPEPPAFAHIGTPGWETDPDGPAALCGARLLGVRVAAGWEYPFICPACVELRLLMLDGRSEEEEP